MSREREKTFILLNSWICCCSRDLYFIARFAEKFWISWWKKEYIDLVKWLCASDSFRNN